MGFVTPMMVAAGATDNAVTQVTAITMGGATLIAYIIGEIKEVIIILVIIIIGRIHGMLL